MLHQAEQVETMSLGNALGVEQLPQNHRGSTLVTGFLGFPCKVCHSKLQAPFELQQLGARAEAAEKRRGNAVMFTEIQLLVLPFFFGGCNHITSLRMLRESLFADVAVVYIVNL